MRDRTSTGFLFIIHKLLCKKSFDKVYNVVEVVRKDVADIELCVYGAGGRSDNHTLCCRNSGNNAFADSGNGNCSFAVFVGDNVGAFAVYKDFCAFNGNAYGVIVLMSADFA